MLESFKRLTLPCLVTFTLVAVSCSSGNGGGRDCTAIGCQSGLTVAFSNPLRQAGTYTFSVELDGQVVSCETALPFSSCSGTSGCSVPNVFLARSGCALPAEQHEVTGLRVLSVARTVGVTIEHDGTQIASETFTPSYVRSQPNGEGCEPVCEQADASIVVP
jgi:hypothetical protein